MKIRTGLILAMVASLFAVNSQAAIITTTTTLDGAQEVGPVATAATGQAELTLDTDTNLADFTLTVSGLSLSDITFPSGGLAFGAFGPVHLHNAVAGQNGDIILPFGDNAFYSATVDGFQLQATDVLAPANLASLLSVSSVYINVHSLANGAGEIRGQLSTAVPEPSTFALLGLLGIGMLLQRRKAVKA